MIKYFLVGVGIVLLGSLYFLNVAYPDVQGRLFFSVFIILVALVKIWESFFTSKEKSALKYHGDWTLLFTSLLYFVVGLFIILEFFIINREMIAPITTLGILIFISAVVLRRWGIKTLGNQWAIHATGLSRLGHKPILITTGPYKYVRHPIYLSYILDLVGLSVLFGTYYSLAFIFLINVPSYVLRSKKEENSSIQRFGVKYQEYMKATPSLIPNISIKRPVISK